MLRAKHITLRPFERKYIVKYRKWINDPEIASLIDRVLPVSEMEHEKWFENIQKDKNSVFFAIHQNKSSRYIGNVWLWDINWRHRKGEVRIVIGKKGDQGKGMGTEALLLISDFAFNCLNLHKIYAYVLASNKRARKSFEKAGFSVEGTLKGDRFVNKKYEDIYFLGKIRKID